MMPVIRISDQTFERLKGHARPLEDSADDVVRKALDALDASIVTSTSTVPTPSKPSARTPSRVTGGKLPQKEFREPLLEVLAQLGGQGSVAEIRALMEPKMAPRLRQADYENVSSGEPRWWNAVCWVRKDLVDEGILRRDSERGIWELSTNGPEQSALPNPGKVKRGEEGISLEKQFDTAMFNIYRRAKVEAGYTATIFLKMLSDKGGLATAKQLINTSKPSDGYTHLYERGHLELTVEALVTETSKWHSLFTTDELARARKRLSDYDYKPKS